MSVDQFILILGTAQDGGYPHVGCNRSCCIKVENNLSLMRLISSIAIIDQEKQKFWLIDLSPDINEQLRLLRKYINKYDYPHFAGIFFTHAHIGHYAGLLNLGLEVLNLNNIPIYAFPKMKSFLENNSIFQQLIDNKNIILNDINDNMEIKLTEDISISAFYVPHRNELSETVGYRIKSNEQSIIYIPDIDSWQEWDVRLDDLSKNNDILILDGTFYNKNEIKNRDITKIPHPTIKETMLITNHFKLEEKNKIYFTHLNHTNKAVDNKSKEYNNILTSGYNILKDNQIFKL